MHTYIVFIIHLHEHSSSHTYYYFSKAIPTSSSSSSSNTFNFLSNGYARDENVCANAWTFSRREKKNPENFGNHAENFVRLSQQGSLLQHESFNYFIINDVIIQMQILFVISLSARTSISLENLLLVSLNQKLLLTLFPTKFLYVFLSNENWSH